MTTNFANGLESMGIPILGQGIPSSFGDYFFVDPDGSDGSNDGRTMDEPFKTVKKAYDTTVSNNNDVIVLSAATAHTIAAEIVVSKNRVHFVGLGGGSRYMGHRTRFEMGVTTGTGKAIIQVTGVGVTFSNIKFRSVDTLSTSLYAVADGGEFTQFSYCSFEKATDLGETGAAELLCNADTGYYFRCSFGNHIYITSVARQNVLFDRTTIAGKVARDVIFEDCLFMAKSSSVDQRNLYGANATDIERFLWLKKCTFWSAKLSTATQAVVVSFGAAQTEGEILLQDCAVQNITDVSVTGGVATGIFTTSPTPSATGTESVQTSAT